jgi:hypothetical protein
MYMGGCAWVLCKHCAILYKRLEYLQILVSMGVSWNQSPKLLRITVQHCKSNWMGKWGKREDGNGTKKSSIWDRWVWGACENPDEMLARKLSVQSWQVHTHTHTYNSMNSVVLKLYSLVCLVFLAPSHLGLNHWLCQHWVCFPFLSWSLKAIVSGSLESALRKASCWRKLH